jgi:hypothetical protein
MTTCKSVCLYCNRLFEYSPQSVPAQLGQVKHGQKYKEVIAYYPNCPHCNRKVEVIPGPGKESYVRAGVQEK